MHRGLAFLMTVLVSLTTLSCAGRVEDDVRAAPDAATPDADAVSDSLVPGACPPDPTIAGQFVGRDCTAIVRLSYTTVTPLAWQVSCGMGSGTTERGARELLAPHVAPSTTLDQYKLVSKPPLEPFVFFHAPGDSGGIGVVSSRTGELAFAGGIVWAGRGEIAMPTNFRPAHELGTHCGPPATVVTAEGFVPGDEMKDERVRALVAVMRTALPWTLRAMGWAASYYVVGYPRTVGLFAPDAAEWIVVIDASPDAR